MIVMYVCPSVRPFVCLSDVHFPAVWEKFALLLLPLLPSHFRASETWKNPYGFNVNFGYCELNMGKSTVLLVS